MIFPRIAIAFLSWQQYLHKGVLGYYFSESKAMHITPWVSIPSNPRSLAVNQSRARRERPCSGDGGHRRRGPRAGEDSGAYCGLVALLVEDWKGRNRRARRGPEAAAEGSPSTAVLRRWTSAASLRTSFSETRGTCTCNQLNENTLDQRWPTETEAAATKKNAGERRGGAVVD
jgi:hypothetical protein